MPNYNLALTPISNGDEAVKYAKKLSNLADKYLLGESSLPHITLCQFEANEVEVKDIWGRISEVWKEEPIELEFKEFSCITFDNVIFWASLLPDKCNELHKLHKLITQVLNKPIKKHFDPHMTLINTKNKGYEKEVTALKSIYQPITDKFILSLGCSDAVGQLTKIIYTYET